MDEAAKVLDRLERIRELSSGPAPGPPLLDELRALVVEAEAWARLEGDERARTAVSALDEAIERVELEGVRPHQIAVTVL